METMLMSGSCCGHFNNCVHLVGAYKYLSYASMQKKCQNCVVDNSLLTININLVHTGVLVQFIQ